MNKIYYIAKKIYHGESEDKKVSQPIVRIARISIILAMAINIVTLAVVTGFQNKVKEKVIGFGSHATIVKSGGIISSFETTPFIANDSLQKAIQNFKGVKNIQPFAYKPALLQSEPDTNFYTIQGIDTFQVQQEIHGVVLKGVGKEYDWTFFKENLIEGNLPDVQDSVPHDEMLISSYLARNLGLKVEDEVNIFFVKQQPIKLKYRVTGIFKTGLQEFDEQIIVGDIRNVQRLNDWGIQASIRVADTLIDGNSFVIYSESIGGNGNLRFDWGDGYDTYNGFNFCPEKDTIIRLIASDYYSFLEGFGEINAIPDTAYLHITVQGETNSDCEIELDAMGEIQWKYLNDEGTKFSTTTKRGKTITFEYEDGKGSHENYIGGYEVEVDNFKKLSDIAYEIKRSIYYQEFENGTNFLVRTIEEDQQDIFLWLDFLDLNVIIIIVLMLLIGTINMGSGLLVLIITKTQLIGLLKAIGTTNWDIRKLFLYQAVFIIFRGMIIGNVIGISLCLIQSYFNIIPLNPEVYYLDSVPIEMNILHIVLLNIGTIVLCTAALIIPSWVITKISPVKAIKFE